jgi:hypothetical protein
MNVPATKSIGRNIEKKCRSFSPKADLENISKNDSCFIESDAVLRFPVRFMFNGKFTTPSDVWKSGFESFSDSGLKSEIKN